MIWEGARDHDIDRPPTLGERISAPLVLLCGMGWAILFWMMVSP